MLCLIEQKEELSQLQDDLVKEQEAVDCLKQIINGRKEYARTFINFFMKTV